MSAMLRHNLCALISALSALFFGLCVSGSAFAAISFVAATSSTGHDERASISVPGATIADDVILAQVTYRDAGGGDSVTGPAGWTLIGSLEQDDDIFQALYYRVAIATDAGQSFEWDFQGNSNRRFLLGLSVFRGVDTTSPIDAEGSRDGMSGSGVIAPSLTTSLPNALLVTFYTIEAGDQSYFVPAGFTEMYDQETGSNNNGVSAMASYSLQVSAGASGTKVATASKSNDDAIGGIVALKEGAPAATELATWYLDEASWSGVANEVADAGPNGFNGRAINGATTSILSPAILGDPGTCYYGVFDDAGGATGDYVEIPGFPSLNSSFSMTAWIRTEDRTRRGQRIFADDENNTQGFAVSVGDPGSGRVRFYSRGVSPVSMDTPSVIANNTWYFVAAVANTISRTRTLYIYDTGGNLVNLTSGSYTGTWGTDSGMASIGGETNSGETGNRFRGNIDEVRMFNGVLTQTEIEALLTETRACPNLELQSVNGACGNLDEVTVIFSDTLDAASATNLANYQLRNAAGNMISLTNATLSVSQTTVTLTAASDLNDLTEYTLTVSNVQSSSGITIAANSNAAFTLTCNTNCFIDTFAGPGALSADWLVNNSGGSFGDPRIVSDGRMRLTDSSGNVATVANLLRQFPGSENRIDVEFDYYAYGGSGADGVAVTFSDASITPVPGGYGGALGYAQRNNGTDGFAGGWLGVGLDEYGNFSNANEGKQGGSGFARDAVALRGSGSGSTGYPFLTSTGTLTPGVDQSGSTPAPGHRYKISLDHTMGGSEAYATVWRDTGSGYVEIVPRFDIFSVNASQAAVPQNWILSFTGSTGGATNIHEIANLQVCTAQPIDQYSAIDHYHISHSNEVLNCESASDTVTITAHDSNHNPVNVTSDTSLTVTTSPSGPALSTSTPVVLAGNSSVSITATQNTPLSNIDFDVTDGSATDIDGDASEDPRLSFVDTALRFYANGVGNSIGNQVAGQAASTLQTLTLRAIQTADETGACESAIEGPAAINVGIAYECNQPATCSSSSSMIFTGDSSRTFSGDDNAAGPSYTDVPLVFNASGVANIDFNFLDAGQITLRANVTDPVINLSGVSNDFWVRPDKFVISAQNEVPEDINGATDSATRTHMAGEDFTLSFRAVNALGNVTENYRPGNGMLKLTRTGPTSGGAEGRLEFNSGTGINSALLAATPVFQNASLPSFTGGAGGEGVSQYTGADYSEVGLIQLDIQDNNYGNAGILIEGDEIDIGRFIPASFAITPSNGTFAHGCATGNFTYTGQPFSYSIAPGAVIEPLNQGGDATQNYIGSYQKLTVNDINRETISADDNQPGAVSGNTNVTSDMAILGGSLAPDGAESWKMNYSFGTSDLFTYSKNTNALVGPYDAEITIAATSLQDSDGVGPTGGAMPSWYATGTEIRYGRWYMENVFGPETDSLSLVARTEYLDASGNFVVNTDDNCTAMTSAGLTTSPAGTASAGAIEDISVDGSTTDFSYNTILANGNANFAFTAPGAGQTGSVDITVDLTSLPWLRFDWGGTGSLIDAPDVSATFGQYRGHDRIIYWREVQP